jgi:hypothetical protein
VLNADSAVPAAAVPAAGILSCSPVVALWAGPGSSNNNGGTECAQQHLALVVNQRIAILGPCRTMHNNRQATVRASGSVCRTNASKACYAVPQIQLDSMVLEGGAGVTYRDEVLCW